MTYEPTIERLLKQLKCESQHGQQRVHHIAKRYECNYGHVEKNGAMKIEIGTMIEFIGEKKYEIRMTRAAPGGPPLEASQLISPLSHVQAR